MTSHIAMRAILGASLGLGILDLAWINLSLAPRIVEARSASASSTRLVVDAPRAAAAPVEAPAPIVAQPITEHVYFATNGTELDAKAQDVLKRVVEQAGTHATIRLEGFADQRGHEAFNRTLSKRRAVAVQAYLDRLGIVPARMSIGGGGEGQVLESTELWRDRRVDIEITGEPR